MVNYTEAIKRPFQDLKKLAIGVVLTIIPVVNLVVMGYVLQNAKSAMKKNYKLTEWGNWWGLFVTGLLALVISVVYAIPFLVVLFFTVGTAIVQRAVMPMGTLTNLPTLGAGFVVALIFGLITAYFTPAAVLNYVTKNKFSAAFEFSEIKKRVFKTEYLAAWLVGGIYGGVVFMVLSFIPVIGILLGAFVVQLTFYTMVAEAWASK